VGIEVSDGLDAITLDQHKFKQVLYNLLSNAVKFTDEGGQVDIHAHRLDPHGLEVQVRDTGSASRRRTSTGSSSSLSNWIPAPRGALRARGSAWR
jgi:K+-sensing histidine kinase KdpD